MKESKVIFDTNALRKVMMDNLVKEQTDRLIDYAKETIKEIGNRILSYHRAHHMDRTGNLINSLCWGVSYSGELQDSGFYREASALSESFLHEFYPDYKYAFPVNGHALAQQYLSQYGKAGAKGYWRVFFAILAPYWGYWEQGFRMKSGGGSSGIPRTERFMKFAVMTEFYDKITNDLRPAKTKIKIHVEKYSRAYNIGDFKMPSSIQRTWECRVNQPQYGRKKRK